MFLLPNDATKKKSETMVTQLSDMDILSFLFRDVNCGQEQVRFVFDKQIFVCTQVKFKAEHL